MLKRQKKLYNRCCLWYNFSWKMARIITAAFKEHVGGRALAGPPHGYGKGFVHEGMEKGDTAWIFGN